ncbi:dihydroxy-acid dehydratase [Nakamurella lactea]|uniref:dihydroxy-acid dehydratase n=1 Tax=Nakamurella lactea TaxID=459515 RepID=UPI001B7FD02F
MSHRIALRMPSGDTRPIIGIADTASDLNPCNSQFTDLVAVLAEAIRAAGGFPVRYPTMSLGEDLMKPSAMLYRNLMAMELEEQARANPLDGVLYLANCDKTTPASLMAAATTDLPSLLLMGGARRAPLFRGRPLGTGTDLWRALDDRRAGLLDDDQWTELERTLGCAGGGSCNTMGTASTMSLVAEALGMALPGGTGLVAGGTEQRMIAAAAGRRIVELVTNDVRPSAIITQDAIDNAATVIAAAAGSTNAVIHLAAVAGRLGLDASPVRMDRIWRRVPLLVDVEPSGSGLVQDFQAAGGTPTLLRSLAEAGLLQDATLGDGCRTTELQAAPPNDVIRSVARPLGPAPTLAFVRGTLAPDGAVIKVAAASPELLEHTGRAVVFSDYSDMRDRLDDPDLEITVDDVIVVRGVGPVGVPGMPEWGMAPIPRRLAQSGVRDMVRVSDGRMSGTSYGTVVLHVAPEAAAGGVLALVQDGDPIQLSLADRRLDLLIDDDELAARRVAQPPFVSAHTRGWPALYQRHVLQAPEGCDLDFLVPRTADDLAFIPPVVGRS